MHGSSEPEATSEASFGRFRTEVAHACTRGPLEAQKPPEANCLVNIGEPVCWVRVGCPNGWRYTVSCRPGHPPRHAPFEPGNETATTHGATSKRRWLPIAERLAADAIEVAPWLSRPAFKWAVRAWAETEARAQL